MRTSTTAAIDPPGEWTSSGGLPPAPGLGARQWVPGSSQPLDLARHGPGGVSLLRSPILPERQTGSVPGMFPHTSSLDLELSRDALKLCPVGNLPDTLSRAERGARENLWPVFFRDDQRAAGMEK